MTICTSIFYTNNVNETLQKTLSNIVFLKVSGNLVFQCTFNENLNLLEQNEVHIAFGWSNFRCKPLQQVGGRLNVNDCKPGVGGWSKMLKKL